jgi:hypothetical protein
VDNYCNVSSFTDPVQFLGASPAQIYLTGIAAFYGSLAEFDAWQAFFDGNFLLGLEYEAIAADYFTAATAFYLSTKLDPLADHNVLFDSGSHSDLHTVPAWNSIKGACGLP